MAGLLREAVDDPDPVLFLEHKKTYRLIKGVGARRRLAGADRRGRRRPARRPTSRSSPTGSTATSRSRRPTALAGTTARRVEVIDLRTIAPLDRDDDPGLGGQDRAGCLVVHEDNISFGVGAEVAAIVAEEAFYDLDAPVRRLAMADVPAMPFAAPMEAAVSIGADEIVERDEGPVG